MVRCQPGTPGLRVLDFFISDRVLGTPTAASAKLAEVAYSSEARNLSTGSREQEILVPVRMELALVTGAMVL